MLKQTIWPSNHTSLKKLYLNEFVANVLGDIIGIVIFYLLGHGGCWRPKIPLGGQKWHKGVDLLKKVLNKSSKIVASSFHLSTDKRQTLPGSIGENNTTSQFDDIHVALSRNQSWPFNFSHNWSLDSLVFWNL